MPHVIEPASSGRAKCRACGTAIAKGQLRFGERVPNPFGDGEATYWFHLRCGAMKRPEPLLEGLAETSDVPDIEDRDELEAFARRGVAHPRLPRIARAQRAPSGRARCRHCHEPIDKGTWRFALDFWEEGRFGGAGFLHIACAPAYFGDAQDVMARARHFTPDLSDEDAAEIAAMLPAAPAPAPASA